MCKMHKFSKKSIQIPQKTSHSAFWSCHLHLSAVWKFGLWQDPEYCQHGGWWHCLRYLYRLGLQQCEGLAFFQGDLFALPEMEVFMDQILQQYAPVDREHIPFLPGFLVSQPSTLCLVTLCFSICGALHAMAQYIPYDGLKHKCPSLLRCHVCNGFLCVHVSNLCYTMVLLLIVNLYLYWWAFPGPPPPWLWFPHPVVWGWVVILPLLAISTITW